VAVDELATKVYLEGVRRLPREHAGLQDRLHVAACARASGECGVDDLDVRVRRPKHAVERLERLDLAGGGPPREHLELARRAGNQRRERQVGAQR
jgi:hypothetical protein